MSVSTNKLSRFLRNTPCACSYLILSLHRQGQSREMRKKRGTSLGIEISNSSPPKKDANTKVPTSKSSQHYPKIHLSVSFLYSHATETSRKVSKVEASLPYQTGPTTTEQQCQAQNATHSNTTLPTSILITFILPSCQTKTFFVLSWMLSRTLKH